MLLSAVLSALSAFPHGLAVTPLAAMLGVSVDEVRLVLFELLWRGAIESVRVEARAWVVYRRVIVPCSCQVAADADLAADAAGVTS